MRLILILFLSFFTLLNAFGEELDLDKCISLTLKESDKIKSSEAGAEEARYSKNEALMNFFPTASVSAKYTALKYNPEADPMVIAGMEIPVTLPDKSRTFDITVAQPLTPLWSIWNGYRANELAYEIAKYQESLTRNNLVKQVITLYYTYQTLVKSEEVLKESEEQVKSYKTMAKNFVDAGVSDVRAVLKIELEEAKLKKEKMNVTGMKAYIKTTLAIFMNVDENSFDLAAASVADSEVAFSLNSAVSSQNNNSKEIKILNKATEASEKAENAAFQPFIPTLSLVAGYSRNWDAVSSQPGGTMFFGASASWNVLFNWIGDYNGYMKARSNTVKTRFANMDSQKMLKAQLVKLYNDLLVKNEEIKIAEAEIKSAKENLRIEENKYKEKLTTETDLLEASVAYRSARNSYFTAVYGREMAFSDMAVAMGVDVDALKKGDF